jgi:hypothetical protein
MHIVDEVGKIARGKQSYCGALSGDAFLAAFSKPWSAILGCLLGALGATGRFLPEAHAAGQFRTGLGIIGATSRVTVSSYEFQKTPLTDRSATWVAATCDV